MPHVLSHGRFALLLVLGVLGFAGSPPAAQAQGGPPRGVSVEFLNSTFKLAFTPEDGNFHIDILELTGETFPFGPFEGSGEGWLAGDLTHGFGSVTFHYACGDLHVSYESFWNTVDYDPLEFVYDCTWEVTGGTGAFRFAHGGGPDLGDLVINHNNNDLTEGTFAATGIISWAPPR